MLPVIEFAQQAPHPLYRQLLNILSDPDGWTDPERVKREKRARLTKALRELAGFEPLQALARDRARGPTLGKLSGREPTQG